MKVILKIATIRFKSSLNFFLNLNLFLTQIPTSKDGKFFWKCMEINIDTNELIKLKNKYHEIINSIPAMKIETTQYNVCDLK